MATWGQRPLRKCEWGGNDSRSLNSDSGVNGGLSTKESWKKLRKTPVNFQLHPRGFFVLYL